MNDADPKMPPPHSLQDSALPAEPRIASLEMGKPTLWSRRMRMAGVALVGALIWFHETIFATLQAPDTSTKMLVMVLAPPCAFVIWFVWRVWDTPKEARRIEFSTDEVLLPLSKNTRRSVSLKYNDIHGIMLMSRTASHALLIDTGELTLGYEDDDFAQAHRPDATRKLSNELNRRIRELPDAPVLRERMQQRFELSQAAFAKS